MKEKNMEQKKYVDSYDNEAFAPQFWEDNDCTVIITQIREKTELEIA